MKTTKILLLFTFHFSLFTLCSAQTDDADKKAMCNSYMRATYIFEGKVDSSKYFTIKTGENRFDNFTTYFVEVKKVIKGNIEKGTIEIMQPAPGVVYKGKDYTEVAGQPSDANFNIISQGIYFCWDKATNMTSSYYKNSNAKTIRYYVGKSSSNNGEIKKTPNDKFTQYFSTLTEFYDYISANYGVKIDSAK